MPCKFTISHSIFQQQQKKTLNKIKHFIVSNDWIEFGYFSMIIKRINLKTIIYPTEGLTKNFSIFDGTNFSDCWMNAANRIA